jgi:hypothetical protein
MTDVLLQLVCAAAALHAVFLTLFLPYHLQFRLHLHYVRLFFSYFFVFSIITVVIQADRYNIILAAVLAAAMAVLSYFHDRKLGSAK